MNLCDIETIRAVLGRHGFHFSKSLGQNFLTDESVPRRIAEMSGAAECGQFLTMNMTEAYMPLARKLFIKP